MEDIKQFTESLKDFQARLREEFSNVMASDYFTGPIAVDPREPAQLHDLQLALRYLDDIARFVSSSTEEIGLTLRTLGDSDDFPETREVAYFFGIGSMLIAMQLQVESARETLRISQGMLAEARAHQTATAEEDQ